MQMKKWARPWCSRRKKRDNVAIVLVEQRVDAVMSIADRCGDPGMTFR